MERWRDAALLGVWMLLNPVVFGRPAHERAWATRAVLGEEQWIAERPMDIAMAVDVAAAAAGLGPATTTTATQVCVERSDPAAEASEAEPPEDLVPRARSAAPTMPARSRGSPASAAS